MLLKTNILKGLFFGFILAGLSFMSACNKDDAPPIQTGYVNITIYPNSTEYLPLNSPGGYVYLNANEPSRGILVYRMTFDEFKAFERTPTYKPDSCCITDPVLICSKVLVDDTGLFIVDTCSGSKWLILDGSVQNGPATYPLVAYQTFYDGNELRIFN
jgi:hypothetical protein